MCESLWNKNDWIVYSLSLRTDRRPWLGRFSCKQLASPTLLLLNERKTSQRSADNVNHKLYYIQCCDVFGGGCKGQRLHVL